MLQVLPDSLTKKRLNMWGYLHAEPLGQQSLAVIGPPGSGKTTLLKHLTLCLASVRLKRAKQAHLELARKLNKLPILLLLRNHAQTIKDDSKITLVQALQTSLSRWKLNLPEPWLVDQLQQGTCLIMLDGLDEVADPALRQTVVEWVERQMVIYAKNRFIITSRPFGYRSNPLKGVTVLEVQPFTSGQVQHFVHNWYLANEIMSHQKNDLGVQMVAQEGAEDLLKRLRNSQPLSDLAVNPLLLTMIATVHRYRSALPGRRVELYAEICEVFLGKRQLAKGLATDLTPAQKQRVLQPLAYHLMCQRQREISIEKAMDVIAEPLKLVSESAGSQDFLKMIEDSSGLLVERENGAYGFAHLTFQEYLSAVHIQEQGLHDTLIANLETSWWRETVRLYGARTDATPVIQACLVDDKPSVMALTLAIECLEEAREVQPEVRARLETTLNQGIEDEDPERRQIIARALLTLRLRRLIRISDSVYVDNSLITHAEYQLFLDEQLARGDYHQPDHWPDTHFPPRRRPSLLRLADETGNGR